jgi:hypothetical protein
MDHVLYYLIHVLYYPIHVLLTSATKSLGLYFRAVYTPRPKFPKLVADYI